MRNGGHITRWIGIDHGLKGAVAVLDADGTAQVQAIPVRKKGSRSTYDVSAWVKLLGELRRPACCVAIEGVRPMSMHAAQHQRSSSLANFAKGYQLGVTETALMGLGVVPLVIQPRTWQRALLPGVQGREQLKKASVELARTLFPQLAAELQGPRGGLRDGHADALLLVYFARHQEPL